MRPVAIGGNPRRIIKLDPNLTKEVPVLRSPRGGGFCYLRPDHRAFRRLTAWFGLDLANVTLAFRESDIGKLAQALKRSRRQKLSVTGEKKQSGRPSLQADVQVVIRRVVESKKWQPLKSLKDLTRRVNRLGKWAKLVSSDTVARAIDSIFEATQDRRFQRVRRKSRDS